MGHAAKVIEQALALPAEERAEVIEALLASLEPREGALSEDAPGFWEEMDRRYDAIVHGGAQTTAAEEVHARLPKR